MAQPWILSPPLRVAGRRSGFLIGGNSCGTVAAVVPRFKLLPLMKLLYFGKLAYPGCTGKVKVCQATKENAGNSLADSPRLGYRTANYFRIGTWNSGGLG